MVTLEKIKLRIIMLEKDLKTLSKTLFLERSANVEAILVRLETTLKEELEQLKEERKRLEDNLIPLTKEELEKEIGNIERRALIYGRRGSTDYNACLHFNDYYGYKKQLENLNKQGEKQC